MVVTPGPKVYLQNRLGRCKQKLAELQPVLEGKSAAVLLVYLINQN